MIIWTDGSPSSLSLLEELKKKEVRFTKIPSSFRKPVARDDRGFFFFGYFDIADRFGISMDKVLST